MTAGAGTDPACRSETSFSGIHRLIIQIGEGEASVEIPVVSAGG